MPKNKFKAIPAVHLFLLKDDQVLLARRFNTGYEDGNYSVPAGHVEAKETPQQAIIREALEETGITLDTKDISFCHIMYRKGSEGEERVDFFFCARSWQGKLENKESHKCDELKWVSLSQLPSNVIPYVAYALTQHQAGKSYSEFDW